MKEFDYKLPYKELDFSNKEIRKLYRIGRGEQGVLLVRPYTDVICQHWKFKTPVIAEESANKIYKLYEVYKEEKDFVDGVTKKYGDGTLDPESGIFTPK